MRDLNVARWTKSSRSGAGNNCVEVADLNGDRAVRDSKDPTGATLLSTPAQWTAFTTAIRTGEFG